MRASDSFRRLLHQQQRAAGRSVRHNSRSAFVATAREREQSGHTCSKQDALLCTHRALCNFVPVGGTVGKLAGPRSPGSLPSPYLEFILLFRFILAHCASRPRRSNSCCLPNNTLLSIDSGSLEIIACLWACVGREIVLAEPLSPSTSTETPPPNHRGFCQAAEVRGIATSMGVAIQTAADGCHRAAEPKVFREANRGSKNVKSRWLGFFSKLPNDEASREKSRARPGPLIAAQTARHIAAAAAAVMPSISPLSLTPLVARCGGFW